MFGVRRGGTFDEDIGTGRRMGERASESGRTGSEGLSEQSDVLEFGPRREREHGIGGESGKDWIEGVLAAEGVRITKEGDSLGVTGEGHKRDVWRDLEKRTVEVQAGMLKGEALCGSDGLSKMAALSEGFCGRFTGGHDVKIATENAGMVDMASFIGERSDVEDASDVTGRAMGPSAIEIDEGSQMVNLGEKRAK